MGGEGGGGLGGGGVGGFEGGSEGGGAGEGEGGGAEGGGMCGGINVANCTPDERRTSDSFMTMLSISLERAASPWRSAEVLERAVSASAYTASSSSRVTPTS